MDDEDKSPAIATSATGGVHAAPHAHAHASHKWHTDVIVEGHDVYHGFVKEISMQGAKLYLEHNLQNDKLVKLQIHIPPLEAAVEPHVIEVTAKINYTIYDSVEDFFRSGVNFTRFSLESDSAYLETRI